MSFNYEEFKASLVIDCRETAADPRGQYFSNVVFANTDYADFSGSVLYRCFPSGIKSALEIEPRASAREVVPAILPSGEDMDSYANFDNAYLRGINLAGRELNYSVFRGADLEGADLRGADFHEADLQGASLKNADIRGAKFAYANLLGVDFSGCDLKSAYLRNALTSDLAIVKDVPKLQRARYLGPGADLCGVKIGGDESDIIIIDAPIYISSISFADADLSHAEFRRTAFTDVDFSAAKMSSMKFYNCTFEGCTFSNGSLWNTILHDCTLSDCTFRDIHMAAMYFTNTTIRSTVFKDVDLAMAKIHNCTMVGVDFSGSDIRDTQFVGSTADLSTIWPDSITDAQLEQIEILT